MPLDINALLAASRASPGLDPNLATTIASGGYSVGNAVTMGQATEGMGETTKWANSLKQQTPEAQTHMWASFDDNMRQMLSASGYQPPQGVQVKKRGFWADTGALLNPANIIHPSRIPGAIGNEFSHIPGNGIANEVATVAGSGLRASQHAYRSMRDIELNSLDSQQQQRYLQGKSDLLAGWTGNFLSPHAWQKAWTETTDGERTYDPIQLRQLGEQHSPDVLNIAKAVAGGYINDVLKTATTPERQQQLAQKISDPEVQDVIKRLTDAKMSFGRSFVPSNMFDTHPTLAKTLSGSMDALFDVAMDPLLKAGPALKAMKVARVTVQGPADVDRLLATNQNVQRFVQTVGTAMGEENGAAKVLQQFPRLDTAVGQMVQDGIKSPEDFASWLKTQVGKTAILQGRMGTIPTPIITAPSLSATELKALQVKGFLRDKIDWASQRKIELPSDATDAEKLTANVVAPVGMLAKRMTTMVTSGTKFKATGLDSTTQLQRFLSTYMKDSDVQDVVQQYLEATNVDGRRNIYKSSLSTVFDQAGVMQTEQGRKWAQNFIDSIDATKTGPARGLENYAPHGIDRVMVDAGNQVSHGIWEDQMNTEWNMPSFKELSAHAKREWMYQKVYGVSSWGPAQMFNAVWKPAVLLRYGFPVRVALDEMGNAMAKYGLEPIKSRIALSLSGDGTKLPGLGAQARTNIADVLASHPDPVVQGVGRMLYALPDWMHGAIQTPQDLVTAHFGNNTAQAMAKVKEKLGLQRYLDGIKLGVDHGKFNGALWDEVSSVEGRKGWYASDPDAPERIMKDGRELRGLYAKPSGGFKEYSPDDPVFDKMWWNETRKFAQYRQSSHELLKNKHLPEEDLVQHMADYIQSNEFKGSREFGARSQRIRDGALVGPEVSERAAAEDWARVQIEAAKAHFQTPDGKWITSLTDQVQKGAIPSPKDIAAIPPEMRPNSVIGPELIGVKHNSFDQIQDWTEDAFGGIGRTVDWMARQPIFAHNFTVSAEGARPWVEKWMGKGALADKMIADIAEERAYRMTKPFIHDPHLRSQFEVYGMNFMPFLFAQRQFVQRWSRTFKDSPEAFREAQLLYGGLNHMGVVQHDERGEAYFMYPGSQIFQKALFSIAEPLFGKPISSSITAGFSGAVKMTVPGLDHTLMPSFGPIVSVPLQGIVDRFPELEPLQHSLMGDLGQGRPMWELVMPTSIARSMHLAFDNPNDATSQLGSAVMNAIQMQYAQGGGVKDDPSVTDSPEQMNDFIERTKNTARIILAARTLFGMSAPASPALDFDVNGLHEEFRKLMTEMPVDEAITVFMTAHPDANAFTVFQSTSAGGASLPANEAALRMMQENPTFFASHPKASGYFLPYLPPGEKSDYSPRAYAEQLSMGLRLKKETKQFAEQVASSSAAADYWDTYNDMAAKRNALPVQAHAARAQLNRNWTKWRSGYMKMHPLFADELNSSNSSVRREQTLTELTQALDSKHLPSGAQTESIRDLMDTYSAWKTKDVALGNTRGYGATQQRTARKQALSKWGTKYADSHPEAKAVWARLIAPTVDPNGMYTGGA